MGGIGEIRLLNNILGHVECIEQSKKVKLLFNRDIINIIKFVVKPVRNGGVWLPRSFI
jgi:hypothetical protein